jgi:hypothetical protein
MVWRRVLGSTSLVMASFAAGAWFGYYVIARPHLWISAVGESYVAGQFTQLQYREAPYAEARAALEAYLARLDSLKPSGADSWHPGETPWLDARGIRVEKTLTLARLAVLHERNSNASEAARVWGQAEALAAQGSWRDPGRDHLREIVTRFDRPFQPPSPKPGT